LKRRLWIGLVLLCAAGVVGCLEDYGQYDFVADAGAEPAPGASSTAPASTGATGAADAGAP
jgi:hypothetical protein